MIRRVELKNFQSHKDTALDFSPGVNVILGPSDSGKSSILRAVYWCLMGKPSGTGFIRKGEKKTSVSVFMDAGYVKRERGMSGSPECEIEVAGSEKRVYKAMGTNVPEEIRSVFGIDAGINFQFQLDQHFLILQSPGEVARQINAITKLDMLDSVLSGLKRDLLLGKRELVDVVGELNSLRTIVSRNSELLEEIDRELSSLDKLCQRESHIGYVRKSVRDLLQGFEAYVYQVEMLEQVQEASDILRQIDEGIKSLTELEEGISDVSDLISSIEEVLESLDDVHSEMKSVSSEIVSLKRKLRNCPVCGSKLTNEQRERILSVL